MTLSDQLYGCWDVVVLTDLSRSLSSSFGARGDGCLLADVWVVETLQGALCCRSVLSDGLLVEL